jgi:hypothetical protein
MAPARRLVGPQLRMTGTICSKVTQIDIATRHRMNSIRLFLIITVPLATLSRLHLNGRSLGDVQVCLSAGTSPLQLPTEERRFTSLES